MTDTSTCWICEGEFANPFPSWSGVTTVDCTTCGRYYITGSLSASSFPMPHSERYRFSYWTKRRTLEGSDVHLSTDSIAAIVAGLPNPETHEKPDILLASLALLIPEPGKHFQIDVWRHRSLACARDEHEMSYFVECIKNRCLVEPSMNGTRLRITPNGWERLAALRSQGGSLSNQAFVAMAFTLPMLALWESVFQPAITDAGFEPRLANHPQHNEPIDARIVADIKQSRFVIADVTGANVGVYFEAGYALGLGRPVIWTCSADSKKDMHFDTRQYNHILWKDADDLKKQLYYRIVATI